MVDEQTYEVGSTLAPLTIDSYNDVREQIFEKIHNFGTTIVCKM
jgi:hypothetical protein